MSNKVLIFVFVVLFILFIGEVVYLFYSSQQKPIILKNQANLNQNEPSSQLLPNRDGEQAINNEIFTYLSKINLGIIKTSVLKNHYEGTFIGLDNKINDESAYYGLKIQMGGQGNVMNRFTYSKDEVNERISFFRTKPGKKDEKITIDDLKVGSTISIDEELNLLENDLNFSLLSAKIILISK